MHRFAAVAVLSSSGQLLMQERGDDALHDPGRWGYPGGDLEAGEDFVTAAVRELREETGLRVDPSRLHSLGVRRFRSETCGEDDEFELFVVRLPVSDDDIVCGEGRQMVFVDPLDLDGRELHQATALTLERVLEWHATAERTDSSSMASCLAGVILVDAEGRILLQERDEHAPKDPDKWGLVGGHLDPGEDFGAGALRELEEETGVRLAPGEVELWREVVADHDAVPGGWDRMQVFVAATDLTDADIDCREGRQIVFVDPSAARGLDLSSTARPVVVSFLDSETYRRLRAPTKEAP